VLVLSKIDAAQQSDLAALLDRCAAADGHPALPEPQRMALGRPDLGAAGARVLLAIDRVDGGQGLVGCAVLSGASDGSMALHVMIDPAWRSSGDIGATLIGQALAVVPPPRPVRLWVMRASPTDDEAARCLAFVPERDLLQMRVPLPLPDAVLSGTRQLATRAFVPGQDDARWLAVNNRAFAGHPEQGDWTMAQLHDRLAADWVDLGGFLVADAPEGNGLLGSCWTKVHQSSQPVLGEIYVIAVDPSHHGQGWGRALTVAGLEWMAARGVPVGMLYTDAANTAAVALYRALGFEVDHVDRSYMRAGGGAAPVS